MHSELAAKTIPVGVITYITKRADGSELNVLFNYDLEMQVDFKSLNTDGEVAEFLLWLITEVAAGEEVTGESKFNYWLVVIVFLIWLGYIRLDHPDYLNLLKGLHSA